MFVFAADTSAIGRKTYSDKEDVAEQQAKKPSPPGKEKAFNELIKDKVVIEGLFTFYKDTVDNSMLMAIKPEQFDKIFLCSETRSKGDGAFFDNGTSLNYWPFYFKQVGKNIMMLEKNLRFRADEDSPMHRAVERGISDHLYASTRILSKPHDSTKAILVDPSDIFIRDAENISYFFGQAAKLGIRFDGKNSYFGEVKSFEQNTEIDVILHFTSGRPLTSDALQNPYSLFHTYHFSLSTLPDTDYRPRKADDRIGHFLTLYQDYTNLETEFNPYVRYIERWDLKKKNPEARMSEPVEPIVFWIDNSTPLEYRDFIAEGIEFWNQSFEKIGFRNAIIAKQMPDDAEWDPADVRYNTINWILVPGGGYAVGPSRANPYTGQIYDANIRISSDWIRYMFNNMDNFITPLSDVEESSKDDPFEHYTKFNNSRFCNYGYDLAQNAAFGLAYTLSTNTFANADSLTREYVQAYLVEVIAHEVGHTLGFRHNFKASSVYSLDQIQDREFTKKNAITTTLMDYSAPNLAPVGQPQGEFYSSVPGPYDDWVIEYSYSDFGDISQEEEDAKLKAIADKSSDPKLVYATDEDVFGLSVKSVDPYANIFDLGDDPLRFCEEKIKMTKEMWNNKLQNYEKDGVRYQKIRTVFNWAWRSYRESATYSVKYIGGLIHSRHHVGDVEGQLPFTVIPAAEQRRAMKFIDKTFFAPDAFDLQYDIWNKLQPEQFQDFRWTNYATPRVDYPIHDRVLAMQNSVIARLYSPHILNRLLDNLERVEPGADRYTMEEMFKDVRRSIWTEAISPANVNSFRRQLQLNHINRLATIYLGSTNLYPHDALTLASNDLDIIISAAKKASSAAGLNTMTKAHFKEVVRQIEASKGAKRNFLSQVR
jgi:hypothetical protein